MSHQEHQQQHQHYLAEQIWREKLRIRGFELSPPPLVGTEEEESSSLPVYETAGNMLSEMFSFPSDVAAAAAASTELLDQTIQPNYRANRPPGNYSEWYSNRQGVVGGLGQLGESKSHTNRDSLAQRHHHQQLPSINADDSASAMHLFLMNPQTKSSSSPSPRPATSSNTLHMLPPNPSNSLQGFNLSGPGEVFWVPDSSHEGGNTGSLLNNPSEIGGVVEGQGLSLSLSSSLQHLNAAKAEELRMEDGGLLFYNQGGGSGAQLQYKYLGSHHQTLHFQGGVLGQNHRVHHVGFGSSLGTVNALRTSKYVKSAQELLEEFCSVGRGQFKKNKFGRNNNNINPSSNPGINGGGAGVSSSSTKDLPPLSAADKTEHQRRKVKLLSMLEEVDRRYSHYREHMQMVVNSFDLSMGFGAAVPYTALARKAMSRHFRCLKDAISAQLKHSCELLGEKDQGTSSAALTKGETPRLRMLEQSLRHQQRAFHQMGLMEQEAWRPQRGLPERSVSILRAWLFEHFLHPYPSDADKHILARQTGLSRNQVSNWFINARVRLWKPMVEEMYQKEIKVEDRDNKEGERNPNNSNNEQKSTPSTTAGAEEAATASTPTPPPPPSTTRTAGKILEINAKENDPLLIAINRKCFSENHAKPCTLTTTTTIVTNPPPTNTTDTEMEPAIIQPLTLINESNMHHKIAGVDETCRRGSNVAADYGTIPGDPDFGFGSTLIRFGTTAGDISLTLGLRHAGNMPERDFGSY